MTTESRIADALARYREFMAEAEAGDVYARMNAAALAARLKRMGASIPGEAPPGAAVAAPAPAPAPKPKPTPQAPVGRETAIQSIGAAHDVPSEMIAAAIADGTSAADFAVAVAHEAEIERVARRVLEA